MNRERLMGIASWLEGGAKHQHVTFDMREGIVIHEVKMDTTKAPVCETSCCIAGAAVQFYDHPEDMERHDWVRWDGAEVEKLSWRDVRDEATKLLDLPDELACRLFYPSAVFGGELIQYSDPAWAARTIHYLLATGVVDWNATRNVVDPVQDTF